MPKITGEFKCWTLLCTNCHKELLIADCIDGHLDESFLCYCPICGELL